MTWFLLAFYSLAVCGSAVAGGSTLGRLRLRHAEMQVLISFVGGLMLSIGVLHLLLHGLAMLPPERMTWAGVAVLAGMTVMFLLLRAFQFHHHGEASPADHGPGCDHDHHDHDHGHDDVTRPGASAAAGDPRPAGSGPGGTTHLIQVGGAQATAVATVEAADGDLLTAVDRRRGTVEADRPGAVEHHHVVSTRSRYRWVGVLAGLSVHTLIDGVALAASTLGDPAHAGAGVAGLATFLSIILHKPLDAISITSLMQASGWSSRARLLANLGFAAMCPLGAGLFVAGLVTFGTWQSTLVGLSLAFSAGVFICISLSDLLPEMEFHAHHRVRLTGALLLGIGLGWGLGLIEPAHLHRLPAEPAPAADPGSP